MTSVKVDDCKSGRLLSCQNWTVLKKPVKNVNLWTDRPLSRFLKDRSFSSTSELTPSSAVPKFFVRDPPKTVLVIFV